VELGTSHPHVPQVYIEVSVPTLIMLPGFIFKMTIELNILVNNVVEDIGQHEQPSDQGHRREDLVPHFYKKFFPFKDASMSTGFCEKVNNLIKQIKEF